MKTVFSIFLVSCFLVPNMIYAQDHTLAVEECIAANSGADSVDCLKNIYRETQQNITLLESKILHRLDQRLQTDILTESHYKLAVSSLQDASKEFEKLCEYQCNFAVGFSGAVASGSGQVNWSCLIELHDWRIQYLKGVLAGK